MTLFWVLDIIFLDWELTLWKHYFSTHNEGQSIYIFDSSTLEFVHSEPHSAYLNVHCSNTDPYSTMFCKFRRHKSIVESRYGKQRQSIRKCIFLRISVYPALCQSCDVLFQSFTWASLSFTRSFLILPWPFLLWGGEINSWPVWLIWELQE